MPRWWPADAAGQFGQTAAFVITIWTNPARDRMPDRIAQLTALGCRRVIPAGVLFWKYHDIFLPYYSLDRPHKVILDAQRVRAAFRLLQGQSSQEIYLRHIDFRLHLNFDGLGSFTAEDQYFPEDIVRLGLAETFVDCGAFDGDSITAFIERTQGAFRSIVGFEPDPINGDALGRRIATLPTSIRERITLVEAAVGSSSETLSFNASGTASSCAGTETMPVACVRLDDALQGMAPTFIKLDIEGAEPDALQGARSIITEERPLLAVCAYHAQSHIWELPLQISNDFDGYHFFLRGHSCDGWELVCYGAPRILS